MPSPTRSANNVPNGVCTCDVGTIQPIGYAGFKGTIDGEARAKRERHERFVAGAYRDLSEITERTPPMPAFCWLFTADATIFLAVDFEQPRVLWSTVWSDKQRESYVQNVAGHIGNVKSKEIKARQRTCSPSITRYRHFLMMTNHHQSRSGRPSTSLCPTALPKPSGHPRSSLSLSSLRPSRSDSKFKMSGCKDWLHLQEAGVEGEGFARTVSFSFSLIETLYFCRFVISCKITHQFAMSVMVIEARKGAGGKVIIQQGAKKKPP
jgi:hypothetical protein